MAIELAIVGGSLPPLVLLGLLLTMLVGKVSLETLRTRGTAGTVEEKPNSIDD